MAVTEPELVRVPKGSHRRRQIQISYVDTTLEEPSSSSRSSQRRSRVYPESSNRMVGRAENGTLNGTSTPSPRKSRTRRKKPALQVDIKDDSSSGIPTPATQASTPGSSTPAGVRGNNDLRSPGAQKTPGTNAKPKLQLKMTSDEAPAPVPDFITQTDRFGNASTPRSQDAICSARQINPNAPKPVLHVDSKGALTEKPDDVEKSDSEPESELDPCETLLDSFRLICCCLLPEEGTGTKGKEAAPVKTATSKDTGEGDAKVKLLPKHHPDDEGKKCLVLDLDETLVHSSFRAVPGADFVIPVQIEDVVHFVYVAKRPGVDEFLTEMAKHYEIVVYTASLNKYADPLLDLLDPNRVIRARLFRESCVYYEGNYVKDLSLLDRDLSQAIIVDNSPSSYIFHPENAIDCSSFIDDPNDRELDQIGAFLTGIKDLKDVRHNCRRWREWPHVDLPLENSSSEQAEDQQ